MVAAVARGAAAGRCQTPRLCVCLYAVYCWQLGQWKLGRASTHPPSLRDSLHRCTQSLKWKFLTALSTDPLSFSANIHYRTALGIIIEHNVFDFGCSPPGNLPLNHSAPLTSAQILDTPCVYTVSRLARQECIIYRPSRRLFRRMSKHTHCHKSIYASASLD